MKKLKEVLYYIGLPFLLLLGVIYALLKKNDSLKSTIEQKERDTALGAIKDKLAEANRESTDAESDYLAIRDKHLRGDGES